ncbi:hypothetical protein FDA94_26600 [Herbidospora galbida]|uniref:Protein kinase domain-containing protein n=1 Tax=Herbidospora galbida TaxID=2575442 RepID=A0A4U3MA76_9ACTN|nr:serine/threonine-protein kinase [Herbidospora galbida]TKK85242.1 hypothetical protein FDA94_26600 [Herbidospora galbida]
MTLKQGDSLTFFEPGGRRTEAVLEAAEEIAWSGSPLQAHRVILSCADGTVRQYRHLSPLTSAHEAYQALDNEILAGLRMHRLCGDRLYPASVSRLAGYEANGKEPFALVEHYRGSPIGSTSGRIVPGEGVRFQSTLLTGARWLNAAGIAHRSISPANVHWDGMTAQITDFSTATIVGAPREEIGRPPWQAPEQRPGQVEGWVSQKEDVWSVGRLIYYVATGRELIRSEQAKEEPELAHLLNGIFGPIEGRPTPRMLLTRLNLHDPVPQQIQPDAALEQGRADFHVHRMRKHPGLRTVNGSMPRPATQSPPPPPPEPDTRKGWWRR